MRPFAPQSRSLLKLHHRHQHSTTRAPVFGRISASGLAWSLCLGLFISVAFNTDANADAERIKLPNGDLYEGEVVDGVRTGQGVYTWSDGYRYEGQFANNRLQGEGTYYWPDGRKYVGEFSADKRQGEGRLEWPNGDIYIGDFFQDQMHGQGTFEWENGDRYTGTFSDGKRSGRGSFVWESGERYDGDFVGGILVGKGQFKWPDGREFAGQFKDGRKQGAGVFRWPNGNRYVGEFSDDVRDGLGVFYWRDGTIYRGQFAENRMHGYGVKQQPEGSMEVQLWNRGQLQLNRSLSAVPHCQLSLDGRPWMFQHERCTNGLAHGRGLAASLDGSEVIADAHFVLGHLVSGNRQPLVAPADPIEASADADQTSNSVSNDGGAR